MELTIDQAQKLWEWIERAGELESLSNAELATVVEEQLWSTQPLLSPASDILSEVIERLMKETNNE